MKDRFWRHVEKGESCWIWKGAKTSSGYGMLGVRGVQVRAHRIAMELHLGRPLPAGALVCHHCDTPLCVNPAHLYVGTPASNVADKMRRGRHRAGRHQRLKGEEHGRAKISEAEAREIIALRGAMSQRAIAEVYGLAPSTVSNIQAGRIWRHL